MVRRGPQHRKSKPDEFSYGIENTVLELFNSIFYRDHEPVECISDMMVEEFSLETLLVLFDWCSRFVGPPGVISVNNRTRVSGCLKNGIIKVSQAVECGNRVVWLNFLSRVENGYPYVLKSKVQWWEIQRPL